MMLILLYGALGRQFGKVHRYDVRNPAEAVRALSVNYKGFRQALVDGGAYRVLRGGKEALALDDLRAPHSTRQSLRIVPVVQGASGLGKIVLGAALIGFAWWNPLGMASTGLISTSTISSIGVSLVLGGVSQMLFSPPKAQSTERPENKPSYAFDGAVNTSAQGNPVPVCYGRMIVGSQVVSAGLSVDAL